MKRSLFVAVMVALAVPAVAGNKPCSNKKGGISHCQGSKFVCNDGSVSQSKRHCGVGNHKGKRK